MIRNQRGMTLIEVLAAVLIMSLLMGGATMLVASIYRGWNESRQSFSDDTSTERVLQDMNRTLSDCRELSVLSNGLQCKHSDGTYTAYVYENHKLEHRELDVSKVLLRSMSLSDIVSDAPAILSSAASNAPLQPAGTVLGNGQLVRVRVGFLPSKVTVTGGKEALGVKEHILPIKLLKDTP